jgi:hypothetical protein
MRDKNPWAHDDYTTQPVAQGHAFFAGTCGFLLAIEQKGRRSSSNHGAALRYKTRDRARRRRISPTGFFSPDTDR